VDLLQDAVSRYCRILSELTLKATVSFRVYGIDLDISTIERT
jgi:hypothetical protein